MWIICKQFGIRTAWEFSKATLEAKDKGMMTSKFCGKLRNQNSAPGPSVVSESRRRWCTRSKTLGHRTRSLPAGNYWKVHSNKARDMSIEGRERGKRKLGMGRRIFSRTQAKRSAGQAVQSGTTKVPAQPGARELRAPNGKSPSHDSHAECPEQLLEMREKAAGCMRRIRISFIQTKPIKNETIFNCTEKKF